MHNRKFRRVKKSTRIQAPYGDKIPPLRPAITEIEADARGPETAVRSSDAALRGVHALAGPSDKVDHDTGLVAVFCGWGTGNHFQRLNGIQRDLIRKGLALLI